MTTLEQVSSYKTEQNDTWDLISFKVFGNESYTEKILQYNSQLSKIVFFPAGIILKIPTIEKVKSGVEPPWNI